MNNLQEQLNNVTRIIKGLSKTDVQSIEDAKGLKSLMFVTDKVMKMLELEMSNLAQLKIRTMAKLASKVADIKPALETAEQQFMIKYSPPAIQVPRTIRDPTMIQVDIGNNIFATATLYASPDQIPIMSYGAVMVNHAPLVIYKFGAQEFVSCTASQVADFSGPTDNFRTICCGNSTTCEYGAGCKYFHDPLVWPEAHHVQRFIRTNMVKKCPYFGHLSLFNEQIKQLNFENLRTLARYCAIMNLMISIVVNS